MVSGELTLLVTCVEERLHLSGCSKLLHWRHPLKKMRKSHKDQGETYDLTAAAEGANTGDTLLQQWFGDGGEV